jgi:hypothetical protein
VKRRADNPLYQNEADRRAVVPRLSVPARHSWPGHRAEKPPRTRRLCAELAGPPMRWCGARTRWAAAARYRVDSPASERRGRQVMRTGRRCCGCCRPMAARLTVSKPAARSAGPVSAGPVPACGWRNRGTC